MPRALLRGVAVVALAFASSAPAAAAHEDKPVGGLSIEMGWANEPVVVGFPNAVALFIRDQAGRPIADLGDALRVEVAFGDSKSPLLTFEPTGGSGRYQARIVPTRPGKYTFRLAGTARGVAIDTVFAGVEEAREATGVQFPVKDPSLGQIAERLDRVAPRLETGVAEARRAAKEAEDAAGTSRTLAIVGLAAAVAALVVALLAVAGRRARPATAPR